MDKRTKFRKYSSFLLSHSIGPYDYFAKELPVNVFNVVIKLWNKYNFNTLIRTEGFQFLRVNENGIEFSAQKYIDDSWCLKVSWK